MTLLLSFSALLPRLLLGFCLTHSVWNTLERKYLLVKIFLAGAIGFGVSSLVSFFWIWSGLPISAYVVVETLIALIAAAWTAFRERRRFTGAGAAFPPGKSRFSPWAILPAAAGILFLIQLAVIALEYPHGRMDAWTNWNVVSRFIFRGGDDWRNTFLRTWDHPDYPLLMPLSNALTWVFLQKNSPWGPIAFHVVLSLSAAGLLFAFVNAFRDFKQAALAGTLFMTQPSIAGLGMSQYADFPLAYLFLAAGGMTLLYFNEPGRQAAVLAGFLAGLAAWTKNEGLVAVLGFTLIWIVIAMQKGRTALRDYFIGLAFPLAAVILFKAFLAPPNDLVSGGNNILEKLLDTQRHGLILGRAAPTLWNIGEGPLSLIGLLAVYGIIVGRSGVRTPGLWMIGLVILLQLAAYFAIYLVTPHDLEWHLKTSFNRLYLHVLPLALLCLFLWLKSPQELSSSERE